jgi:hypothetical protein
MRGKRGASTLLGGEKIRGNLHKVTLCKRYLNHDHFILTAILQVGAIVPISQMRKQKHKIPKSVLKVTCQDNGKARLELGSPEPIPALYGTSPPPSSSLAHPPAHGEGLGAAS